MGFCELLTLIFVAAKLFGAISWSWWLVFAPEFVSLGLMLTILLGFGGLAVWAAKNG